MYKKIDDTSEEIRKVRQNLFTLTVNLRTKFPNINFNLGKEIRQIKFTSTIPNSLDTYNLNLLVLPLVKNLIANNFLSNNKTFFFNINDNKKFIFYGNLNLIEQFLVEEGISYEKNPYSHMMVILFLLLQMNLMMQV